MKTIVDLTFEASDEIRDGRTLADVYVALLEEYGELIQDMAAVNGFSKKDTGADGIAGEAIDVALCALDLLRLDNPLLSAEELSEKYRETILSIGASGFDIDTYADAIGDAIGKLGRGIYRRRVTEESSVTPQALNIVRLAFRIVTLQVPDLDPETLAGMGRKKLEKWKDGAREDLYGRLPERS